MKKAPLLLVKACLLAILFTLAFATDCLSQTDTLWQGATYKMQNGPQGGVYFIDSKGLKHYKKKPVQVPIDNGNGTACYRERCDYAIITGPKGGRYILYNGRKVYLKHS